MVLLKLMFSNDAEIHNASIYDDKSNFKSSQLSQEDCAFTTLKRGIRGKLVNRASFYIRTCIWDISNGDYTAYASLIYRGE